MGVKSRVVTVAIVFRTREGVTTQTSVIPAAVNDWNTRTQCSFVRVPFERSPRAARTRFCLCSDVNAFGTPALLLHTTFRITNHSVNTRTRDLLRFLEFERIFAICKTVKEWIFSLFLQYWIELDTVTALRRVQSNYCRVRNVYEKNRWIRFVFQRFRETNNAYLRLLYNVKFVELISIYISFTADWKKKKMKIF